MCGWHFVMGRGGISSRISSLNFWNGKEVGIRSLKLGERFELLCNESKECDLFEIGRSHFGNPGVVVGSEARFLLQGMNLAFHLCYLVD